MSKIYVQLGRIGDIFNILPLLQDDFYRTGFKSSLMVAEEYSSILEGVSYVDPVIYEGPHYELDKAVARAKLISDDVVVTQVNGPAEVIRSQTFLPANQKSARTTSFQKESWRVAGRLNQWDDLLPLTFDMRIERREEKLLRDNGFIAQGMKKKVMLLALKGNSSPFPLGDVLKELVTLKFGSTWRIVEIPPAERIFDLLALYERSALLIAVDSAPLHLAWGCRGLPVFALTQDKPLLWNGSSWRPNHAWYCRYGDWPQRAVEMLAAIDSMKHTETNRVQTNVVPEVTVWSAYQTRKTYAVNSHTLPVTIGACGKDSASVLWDAKRHPFLKDVLRMAIQRASSDSVQINLTRPNVTPAIMRWSPKPPFYAYRMEEEKFSPIADWFGATRAWWKKVLPEIPDYVLSNDHFWSEGLRALFQKHGATDATGCCAFHKE